MCSREHADHLQARIGEMITDLRADLARQAEEHRKELAAKDRQFTEAIAIVQLLLARLTDVSHVSKAEAAFILTQRWHRRVSKRTVERMVARGMLSFEVIPGTKKTGIPMSQVRDIENSYYVATAAQRSARSRDARK